MPQPASHEVIEVFRVRTRTAIHDKGRDRFLGFGIRRKIGSGMDQKIVRSPRGSVRHPAAKSSPRKSGLWSPINKTRNKSLIVPDRLVDEFGPAPEGGIETSFDRHGSFIIG